MGAVVGVAGALLLWLNPLRERTSPSVESDFVKDDGGRTIRISRAPLRIVSMAPQFTEFIIEVGRGPRLVGVSGGETYPPEATAIPALVGPDGITPDVEAIRAAKPDLVVAAGAPDEPWKQAVAEATIPLAVFKATSVSDALSDMEKVGRLVGAPKRSAEVLRGIRKKVSATSPGQSSRPRVFVETFAAPLQGAGTGGFTGDLVRSAGGELVGPESEYAEIPFDALLSADPDVYVAAATSASSPDSIKARPGFDKLTAVREGRIFIIDDDLLLRPGPRLADGVSRLALLIRRS